jgi:hypothetical protein
MILTFSSANYQVSGFAHLRQKPISYMIGPFQPLSQGDSGLNKVKNYLAGIIPQAGAIG